MESTDQGMPLGGNPSPFSSWGEIGAPHMATVVHLPGLTIGLRVWLFSTSWLVPISAHPLIPKKSSHRLKIDPHVVLKASTSSNIFLHILPLRLVKLGQRNEKPST